MIKATVALLLMLTLLSACGPAGHKVEAVAIDPAELESFSDQFFPAQMEKLHIPGVSLIVVQDGKVVLAKGYGYADLATSGPISAETSVMRIGSISKLFVATAVMQLVEQGKLDLDADVNRYLTTFQLKDTFPQPVTLAQLAEMRTLLLELRPAALVETRLDDLLRQLGEAASGREGIPVTVQVEGLTELPPDVHIALYRITQEALNNVVKHARASQVMVRLGTLCHEQAAGPQMTGGAEPAPTGLCVLLSISDDGRSFDLAQVPHNRLGLGIMHERAQAIGALLDVESQPGHGTQITVLWEREQKQEAT